MIIELDDIKIRDPNTNEVAGHVTVQYKITNLASASSIDYQAVWEYQRRVGIPAEWGTNFIAGDPGAYSNYSGEQWKDLSASKNDFFQPYSESSIWTMKEDWKIQATKVLRISSM